METDESKPKRHEFNVWRDWKDRTKKIEDVARFHGLHSSTVRRIGMKVQKWMEAHPEGENLI